jgi:hypothetical protein
MGGAKNNSKMTRILQTVGCGRSSIKWSGKNTATIKTPSHVARQNFAWYNSFIAPALSDLC